MNKILMSVAAFCAVLAAPALAEGAVRGIATANVNMRSGPSTAYPAVIVIPVGAPLTINGCMNTVNWCDVSFAGGRGWVSGNYIQASYRSNRVYIAPDYYRGLGIPSVTFDVGTYWGRHYRDRDFYRERDRWRRYDWRSDRPLPPPPPPRWRNEGNDARLPPPGWDRDRRDWRPGGDPPPPPRWQRPESSDRFDRDDRRPPPRFEPSDRRPPPWSEGNDARRPPPQFDPGDRRGPGRFEGNDARRPPPQFDPGDRRGPSRFEGNDSRRPPSQFDPGDRRPPPRTESNDARRPPPGGDDGGRRPPPPRVEQEGGQRPCLGPGCNPNR